MDDFSKRLRMAINIRGIKAIELAEKSGVSKSNISSYLSGRYKAKQNGLYDLANALNVSEAWLMGYDVPMDKTAISVASSESQNDEDFFEGYKRLPAEQKQILKSTLDVFLKSQGGK